ncbi:MAG: ABC transporter permease [Chloroflexi bacterium]|nr:ABC transporter permease [Chloroflexota bacterium]
MGVYVVKRLLWLPFLLIIVSLVTFALLRFGPGDPVQIWLGQHQNDQVRERIRAKLGLDDPFVVQYVRYMEGVITRLDFGESFQFRGKSVREVIGTRILVSMQLNLAAVIITLGIGIPVGLLAALRQGTGWDNLIVAIALAFQSLPVFITAPVLLLVFALHLDVLPTSGWGGFFSPKIIMPAVVMGVPGIAIVVRLVRASVLDVVGQDYVRTARAKGLPETTVRYRHILRNALIPVTTSFGFILAGLAGGTFIVEIYFGIPGVGRLSLEALNARDYPVLMAFAIISTTLFVIANLIVDLMYPYLDPRIRLGAGHVA